MATALSTTRRACLPSEGFCSRKSKDRMRSSWGASDQPVISTVVSRGSCSRACRARWSPDRPYAKVEDGDIHIAATQPLHRLQPIGEDFHLEPHRQSTLGQYEGDDGFILDDENARRSVPRLARCRLLGHHRLPFPYRKKEAKRRPFSRLSTVMYCTFAQNSCAS